MLQHITVVRYYLTRMRALIAILFLKKWSGVTLPSAANIFFGTKHQNEEGFFCELEPVALDWCLRLFDDFFFQEPKEHQEMDYVSHMTNTEKNYDLM